MCSDDYINLQILTSIPDMDVDREIHFPSRTHVGEKLAADLNYMREKGCLERIILTGNGKRNSVMQQIYESVVGMVAKNHLQFPPSIPDILELGPTEPNREIRLQFANLPFRILKPGNFTMKGHYLSHMHDAAYHDMEYGKITKLSTKVKNPIDADIGIIFICK